MLRLCSDIRHKQRVKILNTATFNMATVSVIKKQIELATKSKCSKF